MTREDLAKHLQHMSDCAYHRQVSQQILAYDAEQRAEIARLREALQRIVDLLGECRLDHHGACQEHFISNPCEVKQAQQAIKESSK